MKHPSQETETSRRYSVDPKRWADHRKLDLDMKLAGFLQQSVEVTWQQNARTYALLLWADSQNPTIGTTEEKKGATSAGVCGDICHFSYVIFESLNMIMSDSLLSRARACEDGRGLGSSCGEISMRSGVEARHRSFQQKP